MGPAYILAFLVGLVVAFAIHPITRTLAKSLGLVDRGEEDRKPQEYKVPCSGGILILGSSAIVLLLLLLVWNNWGASLEVAIEPELLVKSRQGLGVALGLVGMFMLGAWDDRLGIGANLKLGMQFVVVLFSLLLSELRMTFFIEQGWINLIGTLLWVILITNAFNLIDNMDGLCSVVAMVVIGLHGLLLSMLDHWLLAAVCWLILGPLLSFFYFNRPRAKIYLGDSGSLSLGFFIGMLCVVSTYYHEGQPVTSFFTPILMMAVPLYDVGVVMIHRWRKGAPLMTGDRNHVSHRLLEAGFREGQVLLIFGVFTLTTGISSILIHRGDDFMGVCVVLQTLITLVVFHRMGRRGTTHS